MIKDLKALIRALSKKEYKFFLIVLGFFIVSLVLVTINVVGNNTEITPAKGGTYSEGIVGQPIAINPLLVGSNNADSDLVEVLFADLIALSESYSTSSEGKVWTIVLKENLVWSDNKPITSDDVVFTVQTIQNQATNSPLLADWQGVIVERTNELEIRFTLKSAYRYFFDNLKHLHIAPKHVFGIIPPENLRLSSFNLEPISSGPYSFVNYTKQKNGFISEYKLKANPNYALGQPLIPNLVLRFYPNYNDAILAFNRKRIDGLGGVDAKRVEDIKINHRLHQIGLPRYYGLFFNANNNSLFDSAAIRQALDLATDKNNIVNNIFNDFARVSEGPLLQYLPGFNAEIYKDNKYDPIKAIALLEEDNWLINKDTGVRQKVRRGEVSQLSFTLTTPPLPFLTGTANQIKEQWEDIGIFVDVNVVSLDNIQEQVDSRNYEVLLFGNILRANTDIFSFWHSSERFQPGLNFSLYNNPLVDRLLTLSRESFDPDIYLTALMTIQEEIEADIPAIFLYSPDYLYVGPKNLGGFPNLFIPTPEERLNQVHSWFLETSRTLKEE